MNKRWTWWVVGCVVGIGAGVAVAGERHGMPQASSPELERMKSLAGHWEGTSSMGEGEQTPAAVDYTITSGGSAVVETLFPGTPQEMVSVYHDQDGKLAMTHYCMLGNQPQLQLTNADAEHLSLSFSVSPGIDPEKDQHMHALLLTWEDADHLTHAWTSYEHGQPSETATFHFSRVR